MRYINGIGLGKLDNDNFPTTKSWHLPPKYLTFVFILAFIFVKVLFDIQYNITDTK